LRFFRHLKSLDLDCGDQPLDHILNIRIGLQSLSPTLEKLKLTFRGAEAVLLEDTELLVRTISEEKVEKDDAHSMDAGGLWNIEKYWPKLTFLELDSQSQRGCLRDSDLASLPSTLTELRLLARHSTRTAGMTARLNRNLLNVTVHFEATKESILALPPQLESFEYLGSFPADFLKFLPASLTQFHASVLGLSRETLQDIPVGLKSIDYHVHSQDEDIVKIPSHVEALSLAGDASNVLKKSDFLPSSLLSLEATDDFSFPPNASWPASLTSIVFYERVQWPQERKVTFPPKLSTLVLTPHFTSRDPQLCLDLLLKSLPKSLNSLTITPHSIHRLNFSSLPLLPSLNYFAIDGDIDHSEALYENLSAGLEHFSAAPNDELEIFEKDWVSLVRPSLTYLALSNFEGIPTDVLFTLPTKLTSLRLSLKGHITTEHFKSLPRSLTSLWLPKTETIEFGAIVELPRALNSIGIRHTGSELDISSLPPSLRFLSISCSSISLSRELVDSLPRSLYSIRMESAKLMPEAEEAEWPPRLHLLRLANLSGLPQHIQNVRKAFLKGNFVTPDPRVLQRLNRVP
jgi:hypothetical protein